MYHLSVQRFSHQINDNTHPAARRKTTKKPFENGSLFPLSVFTNLQPFYLQNYQSTAVLYFTKDGPKEKSVIKLFRESSHFKISIDLMRKYIPYTCKNCLLLLPYNSAPDKYLRVHEKERQILKNIQQRNILLGGNAFFCLLSF